MTYLDRRLVRVREMEMRDPNRFKPNPLGPGYCTRRERYSELIWELERRIAKAAELSRKELGFVCSGVL